MARRILLGIAAMAIGACQPAAPGGSTTPSAALATTVAATNGPTVPATGNEPTSGTSPTQAADSLFAIEAVDDAFDAPTVATAGQTTMTFANNGKDVHAAQVARLKPGTTVESFLAALAAEDDAAALASVDLPGGPNRIGPGMTTEVHLDLAPGEYLLYCPVPTPNGRPHYELGMYHAFTVVAGANTSTAPPPDDEIILRDMSFGLPDDTSAGVHTWHVTNDGPSIHEIQLFKLHDGASIEDLTDAITGAPPPGGVPADDAGGFAFTSPGGSGSFTIELTRGKYALLCFVFDPVSKRPHFTQGMAETFDVE